jgi:hypothetical protein
VTDLIAPAGLEVSRSHLTLEGRCLRVLGLVEYPRYVYANWLGRLIDFDAPLDISLHIEPLDSGATIRQLTHRLVEFQSSRMLDARSGKIASAEREVAYEDVERLRDELQRGEERVFSASLYLCLRSPNVAGLDDLSRRVEAALASMLASSRPALFEMLPGLLSCLPAGQDHLGRCRNLETTSVATMIPFTSSHLSMERGILYSTTSSTRRTSTAASARRWVASISVCRALRRTASTPSTCPPPLDPRRTARPSTR